MRHQFIFLSKRLGFYTFLSMFIYLFISMITPKSYGLLPQFTIIFFFISLLFFGFSFLPEKLSKEYIFAWLTLISFMFIAIGGGIAFILAFIFKLPLSNLIITIGSIFFILGIILMITSGLSSGNYRTQNEINEIENSFRKVVEKLNFVYKNKSTPEKLYLEAKGNSNIGSVTLSVENEYSIKKRKVSINKQKLPQKPSISTSKIEITTNKRIKPFKILTTNEAIEVTGLKESLKSEMIDNIKQKQPNYFNFSLYAEGNSVSFNVDVAIEETELWEDYFKLINDTSLKMS